MRIGIIDYGSGNLHSTYKSVERVARDAGNAEVKLVTQAAEVPSLSHIILPGVGAFADCYAGLTGIPGMVDALEKAVHGAKKPFLGICVGMQLLADIGEEHGKHTGLGWINGRVVAITSSYKSLKIPHMGWNDLQLCATHNLLDGIKTGDHAYFVHSYHFKAEVTAVVATVEYGGDITAVVAKDNIMGTQFHPEKSQKTGLTLLHNFLRMA